MKERNALGYLVAFTLGVICTCGVIFVISPRHAPAPAMPPATAPPRIDPPRRTTFQQRLIREPVAPQVDLSVTPADPLIEQTPEEPPPADPVEEVPPPVVQPVPAVRLESVVARRQVGGTASVVPESGRISGKVRLLGEPPAERQIPVDPTCGRKWEKLKIPPLTRFFVLGKDRGLADVVVHIRLEGEDGRDWAAPRLRHRIEQRNCLFSPYVSAVQTGQSVTVENQDNATHNLHLISQLNGEFNRALLPNRTAKFDFEKREDFVRFKCDVHPWEFAYVSVFDHPYFAVTDQNGIFVLHGVPAGKYVLEARHRKAGVLLKEIEVDPKRNIDVQFDFENISERN